MRVILGICSVVSFSFPVFADPILGEKAPAATKLVENSIADASTKITNLEARKDKLAKTIYDSQRSITSAYTSMKNAQKDLMNASGGASAPLTDKQRDIYLKAQADYKKTQSEFAPALLKAKADLGAVDKDLEALSQTAKAEKYTEGIQTKTKEAVNEAIDQFKVAKVEKQNSILQNRIRSADLRSSFMDLDIKTIGVENTLNDMEKIYDKSVLGAYLQDKFGQLLNSQSICSAVKRCAVADPKKIDPEKIRKELFPESEAIRSDYYDKVNKKQATPVQ